MTSIPFQVVALDREQFQPLFARSDEELAQIGAMRIVADGKPGYPCRVSLVDADPGERLLSLHFTHHDVRSPYRVSGPIFVREGATNAGPGCYNCAVTRA